MRYLLFPFLLFLLHITNAQSPYKINWKKESIYFGTGAGIYTAASILETRHIQPLSRSSILSLDRASVNNFDRNATFNNSLQAKRNSDILKVSSYTFSTLFLTHPKTRKDFGKIITLHGETVLITAGLTALSKRIFLRPRPYVFNELVPMSAKRKKYSRYAFFSGHAALAAANSVFAAKVFSDYFPESKWKPVIWATAILVPAGTGYFRVMAGKHYPSDVIIGVIAGSAVGFLVPHIHRKDTLKGVSAKVSMSGVQLAFRF